jgi:hypothetical protein
MSCILSQSSLHGDSACPILASSWNQTSIGLPGASRAANCAPPRGAPARRLGAAPRVPIRRESDGSPGLARLHPGRFLGVEPQHPFAHRLHPNPTNRCRFAPRAPSIGRRQRQQPPNLARVTSRAGQPAQCRRVVVPAKGNRCRPGKPPLVFHAESYLPPSRESPVSLTYREEVLAQSRARSSFGWASRRHRGSATAGGSWPARPR